MISEIQEKITDFDTLRRGYVVRNGFIFAKTTHKPVFDSLVIRNPCDAVGSSISSPASERSLEDHIQLIKEYQLEKAVIICNDLSFITQCPSLTSLAVYPNIDAKNDFDFSPLYQMPNIRELYCATTYGYKDQFRSAIDYSKIKSISCLSIAGSGHLGYEDIPALERLWMTGSNRHDDFSSISSSALLKDVTIMQCGIKTLNGITKHPQMQDLAMYHCRSLSDISALAHVSKTLRSLTIESCPQITDFSVLEKLCELEHLHLYGNNTLPNLNFLGSMRNLKTFCFTMNVQNGDLTLCKDIPYASCKNRKHYNMKDQDLPKNRPSL